MIHFDLAPFPKNAEECFKTRRSNGQINFLMRVAT